MSFDLGFDFRSSSGFASDPAYAVGVLNTPLDVYPVTFTNANGDSVNAGRVVGGSGAFMGNQDAGNDPRIAGYHWYPTADYFRVDIDSGSAPGPGSYNIDLAVGRFASKQDFAVYDDSTLLIDGSNGGAGYDFGGVGNNNYVDASLNFPVAATTTWTGTPSTKTFTSTTAKLFIKQVSGSDSYLSHFRLTAAAAPPGGPLEMVELTLTGSA